MQQKNRTILGIDVHSREYGYAVFEGNSFSYGEVKLIKSHKTTKDKCNLIHKQLATVILREQPSLILWEQLTLPYQRTPRLQAILNTILLIAIRNRIQFQSYSPSEVKGVCTAPGQEPTRQNMCRYLANHYPYLKERLQPYEPNRDNGWKYWLHLFNAIAVVHTHLERTKHK